VQLRALTEASAALAATRSRNAKIHILANCLRALGADERAIGVAWLSGYLPEGRLGLGPAAIRELRGVEPAAAPSLTVAETHAHLERLRDISGRGSTARRRDVLAELFRRATGAEQDFLSRLLLGELRQGALEGVMADGIASAAELPLADVHRAIMLAGDVAPVAAAALAEGRAGLDRFRMRLYEPVKPMLASPADDVEGALTGFGAAAFEYKLDGARVQIHKGGDGVRLYSRRGRDVTDSMPEIVAAFERVPAASMIVDGEVLALNPSGRPRPFQDTMRRFGRKRPDAELEAALPLSLFCFDCLHVDGDDVIDRPTETRVAALTERLPAELVVPRLVTSDLGDAERFLRGALDSGHEGLMAKSLEAPYEAGRRGSAWLKIKVAHTLDLVVLAAEWGSGRRSGWLSNLHLGARDPDTRGFVMLGKTFKGLTDALLTWQTAELLARETHREGHVVHVRPELVVEIAYEGVQRSPRYPGGVALRFARVKRYRDDKTAAEADTIDRVRSGLA
jgi:DNA ligase 1